MKHLLSKYIVISYLLLTASTCFAEFVVPMYETDSIFVVIDQQADIYKYLDKSEIISDLHENKYVLKKQNLNKIRQEDIIFQSIVLNSKYNEKYAMDNCIILNKVSNLDLVIKKYNLSNFIVGIDSFPPIHYLHIKNMNADTINKICKKIQANNYCQTAEPNYWMLSSIIDSSAVQPSTNPEFVNQWGLYNTPSSNFDVNAIEAWKHSTGQNVKVAITDGSFQLNHPDLQSNILVSYDCTNGADGSINGQCLIPNDSHGTQCAGIIAATNNNVGTIGIAPNVDLITIRRFYYELNDHGGIDTFSNSQWNINSIITAYQVGADIISCSWSNQSYYSTTYNDCINTATTQGRNGKGCVVVFSTGNNSTGTINYPTNLQNTLAVGNSDINGKRNTTSNYGNGLDIVAPGTNIRTTQTIGWGSYCYSTGTSMACPMVAGVAALMLSVNPNLSWQEVRSIIRQTAYKLPTYTFCTTTSDGTWNNEVGYGLVDANAAVLLAGTKWIQNKTYTNVNNITKGVNLLAGYSVTSNHPYGNVIVQSGSTVHYKATNKIVLKTGFIAAKGSNFRAQIVDVNNLPIYAKRHIEYETNDDNEDEIININKIISSQNNIITKHSDNNHISILSTQTIQSIHIYNITGQCVIQTRQTDIDVSSLSAGVYIVVATTSDGISQQSKFIHL